MKCDRCGNINSEFNIICVTCGAPLDIDNNEKLKKIYNNKQKAIEIEEVKIDNEDALFQKTKKRVKNVIILLVILLLVMGGLFLYNIYNNYKATDVLNRYEKFIESDNIGILYIGNDRKGNKYLEQKAKEYEYNYLYINYKTISKNKRKQIKRKLGINKLSNTIVVLDNKKLEYYYHDFSYNNKKELEEFLGKNNIFPKILGNSTIIIKKFDNDIKSEKPFIIYFVSSENKENIEINKELEIFTNNYSIEYNYINGDYLTISQKQKLFKKINYSNLLNEAIIIVDNKKIIGVIDEKITNYYDMFSKYGIIDSSSIKSLKQINQKELEKILESNKKQVVLLTSDNCDSCELIKPIIGKLNLQYDINVYLLYINSDIKKLEKYLRSKGYKEQNFAMPVLLITENDHIIDIITGVSELHIYEDIFKELGIIRQE